MSDINFVLADKDVGVSNLEYQKMKHEINFVAASLKHRHSVESNASVSIMSLLDVPFYARRGRFGMDDPIYAIKLLIRKSGPLAADSDRAYDTIHIYTFWLSADCDDLTLVAHRKININLREEKERLDLREFAARYCEQLAMKSALLKLGEKFADPNISKPKGGK